MFRHWKPSMNTSQPSWAPLPCVQRTNPWIASKTLFPTISTALFYRRNLTTSMLVMSLYRSERSRWNTSFVLHHSLRVSVRALFKSSIRQFFLPFRRWLLANGGRAAYQMYSRHIQWSGSEEDELPNLLANDCQVYHDVVSIVWMRKITAHVFLTIDCSHSLSSSLSLTLTKKRQLDGGIEVKEIVIRVTEQPHQKQEQAVLFLTYTSWPMNDAIPTMTQSFLTLIHLAHSYQLAETPLLIHCNTGVGRTGCTLLISLLLIKMIRGRSLDIYSMAKECRRQRCGLIQTEQQYRFVYECARDALNMAIEHSILRSAQ